MVSIAIPWRATQADAGADGQRPAGTARRRTSSPWACRPPGTFPLATRRSSSPVSSRPPHPTLISRTQLASNNSRSLTPRLGNSHPPPSTVVDSGIDMTHPDLAHQPVANMGEICGNGLDDDNNGYVDDCRGYNFADNTGSNLQGDGSHGTHCAGIVAADSDNNIGVAGTAGGAPGRPGASLMILTTFGQARNSGFQEAIVYGADMGAAISSNSWGYTRSWRAQPSRPRRDRLLQCLWRRQCVRRWDRRICRRQR